MENTIEALFTENLPLIDRVTGNVCRRARLSRDEAEDFAAFVKLTLIENDYAVLQRCEKRSSMAAYLCSVIRRLLTGQRDRELGRWRASAKAARLGDAGVLVEKLVIRDGRGVDEVLPILRAHDPSLTHRAVAEMAEQFRLRVPRRRPVTLDETDERWLAGGEPADALVHAREVQRFSRRASDVVRRTMARWPDQDVLLIRFRYGRSLTIPEISRKLRLPRRPLYRRIESLLRILREAFVGAGLDAATLFAVIGDAWQEMDFGLDDAA